MSSRHQFDGENVDTQCCDHSKQIFSIGQKWPNMTK